MSPWVWIVGGGVLLVLAAALYAALVAGSRTDDGSEEMQRRLEYEADRERFIRLVKS